MLLQTLRNKAGLVIIITIGLALAAFILNDLFDSRKSYFAMREKNIAKVNGVDIPAEKYFETVRQMEENYQQNGQQLSEPLRNMIATQAWETVVQEALMGKQFEELGLGVPVKEYGGMMGITAEELNDMILGNNVDPQVQQIFRDPKTNMYDKNIALNFLQNMDKDPQRKQIWLGVEKQLMNNRLTSKYMSMVLQGLYITGAEAKQRAEDKNKVASVRYVALPYTSIVDSTIKPSDDELNAYYLAHKKEYEQKEETRDIEYVVFNVMPSEEDYRTAQKVITDLGVEFQKVDDDEAFVNSNSETPFDPTYYKKGQLPASIDSAMFLNSVGFLTPTYFDGQYFKISKLVKKSMVADSVKARHILIKAEDADSRIDSIKKAIAGGADFAALATQYSEDPGSKDKGGDLGWFAPGTMVKAFNDTCFFGKKDKLYVVKTQFGTHLLQVTDKASESNRVQVATLAYKVAPSTLTRNKIYSSAVKFAGENTSAEAFKKATEKEQLQKQAGNNLKLSERTVAGIEYSRPVVKWAFESDKNAVSNVFECGNKFVVATLTAVKEKGTLPLESVKEQVSYLVVKEKKGAQLAEKIKAAGAGSMQDLAAKLGVTLDSVATEVSFGQASIPNLGLEPKINGSAPYLPVGKVSDPILGESGVYAISVESVTDKQTTTPETEKEMEMRNAKSRYGYSVMSVLKEQAAIKDNRSQFE